jgi:hypothetical protein
VTYPETIADRLRRKDAELRGTTAGLPEWSQLQDSERERWLLLADEATSAVLSGAHARHLADRNAIRPKSEAYV